MTPKTDACARSSTSTTSSCAAAIDQATVLLVHGMDKTQAPIANLSSALGRMSQTLSDNGIPLFSGHLADWTGDLQVFREALVRDLAVCIESLQFHDRFMQQLTEARDILTGLATNRFLAQLPAESANEGSIELF
jgi:hypothetical protein